jgi:hypothetical protein
MLLTIILLQPFEIQVSLSALTTEQSIERGYDGWRSLLSLWYSFQTVATLLPKTDL